MKIILAGATGFIGKPLVDRLLAAGHALHILTRRTSGLPWAVSENLHVLRWDAKHSGEWTQALDGADAVINLAGEPIAGKRWTAEQKEKLLRSRVDATRALVQASAQAKVKPGVLINSSAVGYYGPVDFADVIETTPRGAGFLAGVCETWENEAKKAGEEGVRTVLVRTGIVLEKGGGALAKMEFPFKIFAGGPLGSGRQWFPWIHREDLLGIIEFALAHDNVRGPVNAAAPHPVTMNEFCRELGRALHRPSWARVPAFALNLLLGEMSEMLLTGQKAMPKKALEAGYRFKYNRVDEALKAIYA